MDDLFMLLAYIVILAVITIAAVVLVFLGRILYEVGRVLVLKFRRPVQ